ncbi:hypothetical protein FQN57_004570 [Myotisia sp. PD_48]|nr:hypothetical protein FQN57_004570 [Myotisia sp. PD_48]
MRSLTLLVAVVSTLQAALSSPLDSIPVSPAPRNVPERKYFERIWLKPSRSCSGEPLNGLGLEAADGFIWLSKENWPCTHKANCTGEGPVIFKGPDFQFFDVGNPAGQQFYLDDLFRMRYTAPGEKPIGMTGPWQLLQARYFSGTYLRHSDWLMCWTAESKAKGRRYIYNGRVPTRPPHLPSDCGEKDCCVRADLLPLEWDGRKTDLWQLGNHKRG